MKLLHGRYKGLYNKKKGVVKNNTYGLGGRGTSIGGGSMKSKESKSLIPIAFSERTVLARLVLWISGTAVGNISSRYALSV